MVDHVHAYGFRTIDPRSGDLISNDKLKIGSEFFYPLHFGLHSGLEGIWAIGSSVSRRWSMLAALVTGVVIHRKIFREFFTFRPRKQTQRSTLDLHNLTGVVALPFHFFFAFTGLVIFASIYLPVTETMFARRHEAYEKPEAAETGLPLHPAGVAAPLASVDAMVLEAQRRWASRGMAGEVGFLQVVVTSATRTATVSVYRAGTDRVTLTGRGHSFPREQWRGHSRRSAAERRGWRHGLADGPASSALPPLAAALVLCARRSGGLRLYRGPVSSSSSRSAREQHAKAGSGGIRWVDAVATGTVTGSLIATATILVVEPCSARITASAGCLGATHLLVCVARCRLLHAAWRSSPSRRSASSPAWREQCWAIAVSEHGSRAAQLGDDRRSPG